MPSPESPSAHDLERARAMLDPLRLDLYDAISVDGPLTLEELQARFPESRGALKFDLTDLAEVGHITQVSDDPPTWAAEPGSMAWNDTMLRDPEGGAAMAELDRIVLQKRIGYIRDWSHHREQWGTTWGSATLSADWWVKMNPAELDALRRELEAVTRKHRRAAVAARRESGPREGDRTVFMVAMGFPCRIGREPIPDDDTDA